MNWQQGLCCNVCGKELDLFDIQEDFSICKARIGYGSAYDGDAVALRMCCGCFDRLVSGCALSPVVEESEAP